MARLIDPRLYGIITQDVLARKAFPLVIDKMAVDSTQNYEYKMFNSYVDNTSTINITSKVGNGCAIAQNVIIGSDSQV